jgi:hypothetical protein
MTNFAAGIYLKKKIVEDYFYLIGGFLRFTLFS